MTRRRLLALGLAGVMALSLAACSTPASTDTTAASETTAAEGTETADGETSTGDKIFRYALTTDIATFDPNMSNALADAQVIYHLYDGLYRNVSGDIQPAVATSYELSDDLLTYTFYLREDAYWSDGVQVTAHDFEYGLKRLMDPDTAAPGSYLGAVLANGSAVSSGEMSVDELGVEALDDFTLQITLAYPADYFLGMLSMSAFMPVRQDIVEQYGTEFATTPDKQVYNGPFVLTGFGSGEVTLAKNDSYWDADSIKLDGIQVLTVADQNTQLNMFNNGELDYVELSTDVAAQYEGEYEEYYNGANDYAAFNHNNEYLANKNFRLAMNYALNREEYILLTHNDLYEANLRYVLPLVAGADGQTYGEEFPYEAFPLEGDQDLAQQYLAAALEELGGISASDITLKLVVSDTDTATREAEVVANQWETNLGINIEITQVPGATRNAMLVPDNEDFDIIMTGWVPDYSDAYSYLELWISDSGYNYLNYHSDEYDAYLEAAQTTSGAERQENLFNAEQVLLEDAALAPLQLRKIQYLLADGVTGLETYFVGLYFNCMYVDMQ